MTPVRLRVVRVFAERRARGAEHSGANTVVRLVRERRGAEHPAVRADAEDVEAHGAAHGLRLDVRRIRRPFVEQRTSRDLALRSDAERPSHAFRAHLHVLQLRHAPVRNTGRQLLVVSTSRLQDEAAAPGKLRGRRIRPQHPDDRLHHVLAGREPCLVRLVEPVLHHAAMGTERNGLPVDEQRIALVAAHVERKRRGVCLELLPEAQERILPDLALRDGRRMPDPARVVDLLQTRHVGVAALKPLRTEYLPDLRRQRILRADDYTRQHRQRHRICNLAFLSFHHFTLYTMTYLK